MYPGIDRNGSDHKTGKPGEKQIIFYHYYHGYKYKLDG